MHINNNMHINMLHRLNHSLFIFVCTVSKKNFRIENKKATA